MSKMFVLDTNVLLHDPTCIYKFKDNDVVIPICCLEELDKFKSESTERGANARAISRLLNEFVETHGSLTDFIPMKTGGRIGIFSNNIDFSFNGLKNSYDNLIIAVAKHLSSFGEVELVSNDINMRIKAASLGLRASEYRNDLIDDAGLIGKPVELNVGIGIMLEIYNDLGASLDASMFDFECKPYENMPVIVKCMDSGKQSALCLWKNGRLVRFKQRDIVSGISTKGSEQAFLMNFLVDPEYDLVVVAGEAGSGKCLGEGTPVLMYDGTIKSVENVVSGDLLMGPDSKQRKVESTTSGTEELFKITPKNGDPYVVNRSHILSLAMSGDKYGVNSKYGKCIHNITIDEYLSQNKTFKKDAKTWRAGVEFNNDLIKLNIPSYILGVWVGDGDNTHPSYIHNPDKEIIDELADYAASIGYSLITSEGNGCQKHNISHGLKNHKNCFKDFLVGYDLPNNKHIPQDYKTASRNDRLELLAGLIDSDGHLSGPCCYDYVCKEEILANDIAFLARSLGFAAYVCDKEAKAQGWSDTKTYYRVCISGDCHIIPCRVQRKKSPVRRQIKDVLVSGISVESIGIGKYYGFAISGEDRLFLLGDFTVTHNTLLSLAAGLDSVRTNKKIDRVLFTKSIVPVGDDIGYVPGTKEEKMAEWVKPMHDNMELIMKKTGGKAADAFKSGDIEIDALTYIRGRSLMNRFVIIDEVQNLTPKMMRTIVTRIGEGAKLVLLGDLTQIDSPYLNSKNNGLIHVLSNMCGLSNVGILRMFKTQRSRLAQQAIERL